MKKILEHKIILFDLDNTLLDFTKAENYAIRRLAQDFNITLTDSDVTRYKEINEHYWHLSDSGQMSKKEILKRRFIDFFSNFNLLVDGAKCDDDYRNYLTDEVFLVEGTIDLLEKISKDHDLYVVSNGVKSTQYKRMKKGNIEKYFKKVFLSDEIGFPKPESGFFDYVIKNIDDFNFDEVVLVGDNLFTDINGANKAGIKSCYFNFFNKPNTSSYKAVYEIKNLNEILEK